MGRSRVEVGLSVIVRSLVFVENNQSDGSSEGYSVLCSRLDSDLIVLVPLDQKNEAEKRRNRQREARRGFGGRDRNEESRRLTGVVISLWPGRRRESCTWISFSVSSRPWRRKGRGATSQRSRCERDFSGESRQEGTLELTGGTPSTMAPTDLQ